MSRNLNFSADFVRRRLALDQFPIPEREPVEHGCQLTPAAVLVPLVARSDGLRVLLTRRTAHLNHHPGQISFPGGRFEAGDADAWAAALRETEEEIGVPRAAVEYLGRLPDYPTTTGFMISPVVGLLQPPLQLAPDSFEVEEIFEVPLNFLADERNHARHAIHVKGHLRQYWAMPWGDYFIWGATAGILKTLSRTLLVPEAALSR